MGRRIVVLAARAMGRIIVKDLAETFLQQVQDAELVVADFNRERAREQAAALRHPRISAAFADAQDLRGTARLLRGALGVIHAVQYQLNLSVMRGALAARAHYVDLGGLFHVTRQQLRPDPEFHRIGVRPPETAVPVDTFIMELRKRRMTVRVRNLPGGSGGPRPRRSAR